ncbi:MAG TPA: hypothetical protein VIV12_13200 [Streptosporangiaceae bacterium]
MATLQFLRRSVGGLTGDLDILVATASGSTTTFTDELNGAVENTAFVGRFGYFSGGTAANLARTVRVTDNDKSTQTLTFLPAVPSSTATADTLELYNKDGQGPTVRQIHDAVNLCIEFVGKGVLSEALDTQTTFAMDSPELTIPATWRRLAAIEYQEDTTALDWVALPEADWVEAVDRVGYTVRVGGTSRWLADTRPIRLRGYTASAALSADADITLVDTEWLVHAAVDQLLLMLATQEKVPERRAADYRATSQYMRTNANAYRAKVPTSIRGATGVVLGGAG